MQNLIAKLKVVTLIKWIFEANIRLEGMSFVAIVKQVYFWFSVKLENEMLLL